MLWLTDFLTAHIIEVYFIYGLAFFTLGMAVALEAGHASALPLARATPWLAGFGFLHAAGVWIDMFTKIGERTSSALDSPMVEAAGVAFELISFLWLLKFGCVLVDLQRPATGCRRPILQLVIVVYVAGVAAISTSLVPSTILWVRVVEVWTSNIAGLSAFAMTVWGLVLASRAFSASGQQGLSREMRGAAIAFCWYAVFDSVFVSPIPYFPASVINSTLFISVVGIPIQIFRAANALVIAAFYIRALRIFVEQDRRQLEEALMTTQRLQESGVRLNTELRVAAGEMSALYDQLRQRDEVHSYLLSRVVRAQEEERRRVARDLHDGVGQTLSGLAAGLAALESRLSGRDSPARPQMENMRKYAIQSVDELHRVITDLRPSLLDELGLVAALRWYARHYGETLPIKVTFELTGQARRLPAEIEIILFRIAQEALTNVVRHARANQAIIHLRIEDHQAVLAVEDDGVGFRPDQAFATTGEHRPWGLLGMQERAALVGGSVEIRSQAWEGTKVHVIIPLPAGDAEQGDREQETDAHSTGG